MKLDLALDRKLMLLVGIPLAGALIFSGIGMVRFATDDFHLRRVESSLDLTGTLTSLRESALREQRDSWDLFKDPARAVSFRNHTEATNAAFAGLKKSRAGVDMASRYDTAFADALSAVDAAYGRLAEAREYFMAPKHEADPAEAQATALRAYYVELSDRIVDAINLLTQQTDIVPIRARLDGLVCFGRLHQTAEDERVQMLHCIDQARPTIASLIRLQNATALRTYYQSNAVLMAQPELQGYWNSVLGDPVYAGTQPLIDRIFNSSATQSEPLKRQYRDEWITLAEKRNELLDAVEPHLLDDVRAFVANDRAVVERQWRDLTLVLGALVLVSAAIALGFIRLINGQLRRSFSKLDDGIDEIARSVGALRSGAQRLADGAAREAAGLQQTGASLATLTSGNEENVGTAQKTVEHMKKTGALVASSRQAMQELSETMTKISESSNATFRIVKTIDEIAFQTNILAFNASIEAATAGSAGAGFSVVAEEVRDLAKRASEATAETGRLVEDARAAIASGVVLNKEVEDVLREVDANATHAGELMLNIHTASSQMLQNMQHINSGNRSMEAVTQQNAAIADHNAGTATAIAEETERLNLTIRDLELRLMGKSHAA